MDSNIIARLNAYAEDCALLELRNADLEAERDTYRALSAQLMLACRQLVTERGNLKADNMRLRVALDDRSRTDENYSQWHDAHLRTETAAQRPRSLSSNDSDKPARTYTTKHGTRRGTRSTYRRSAPMEAQP